MCFLRPIQWYHSHADPIWPDSTFNTNDKLWNKFLNFFRNNGRENSTLTSLSILSYSNDKDSCSTMCGVVQEEGETANFKTVKKYVYLSLICIQRFIPVFQTLYLFMFWNAKQSSKRELKPPHHKKLKTYLTFLNHFVFWVWSLLCQSRSNRARIFELL